MAAGRLVDEDPQAALEHARAARALGARVAVVREAAGETAYAAGEWAEAIAELRTARRITGDDSALPLIADSERALGRPERALRIAQSEEVAALPPDARAEMLIVEAGARRDLGQLDAALNTLEGAGLDRRKVEPWSARLWYAYGDLLLAAERTEEAREWFVAAASADTDGATDADERIMQLDGVEVVLDEDEEFDEDSVDADDHDADAVDEPSDSEDASEVEDAVNGDTVAEDTPVAKGTSDLEDAFESEDAAVEDAVVVDEHDSVDVDDEASADAVDGAEDVPDGDQPVSVEHETGEDESPMAADEPVRPVLFTHVEPQPEEPAAGVQGVEPALFSDVPAGELEKRDES